LTLTINRIIIYLDLLFKLILRHFWLRCKNWYVFLLWKSREKHSSFFSGHQWNCCGKGKL